MQSIEICTVVVGLIVLCLIDTGTSSAGKTIDMSCTRYIRTKFTTLPAFCSGWCE